jgi:hypothetical protein
MKRSSMLLLISQLLRHMVYKEGSDSLFPLPTVFLTVKVLELPNSISVWLWEGFFVPIHSIPFVLLPLPEISAHTAVVCILHCNWCLLQYWPHWTHQMEMNGPWSNHYTHIPEKILLDSHWIVGCMYPQHQCGHGKEEKTPYPYWKINS